MRDPAYVPDAGDVVWIDLDPQLGREQRGRRPALVLSPRRYNAVSGLMLCCPMTSRRKGYPFEVVLEPEPPSVVLADAIRSVDWRQRNVDFKSRTTPLALRRVRDVVRALIDGSGGTGA